MGMGGARCCAGPALVGRASVPVRLPARAVRRRLPAGPWLGRRLGDTSRSPVAEAKSGRGGPVLLDEERSAAPFLRSLGGTPFAGVAADITAKAPFYASDFGDGANSKAAAAAFFMFFSSFANAATFGTLMGAATGQDMGVLEMIIGTGVAGTLWGLAGSQPLAVLCHTGPTLAFTTFLYVSCSSLDLPFLPVYTATGLWIALYMLVFAATGLTDVVRYISRYTDEVFAALCAAIFVSEVYKNVAAGFAHEATDVALLQLGVSLFVFGGASVAGGARKSRFLSAPARNVVADFGAPAAVLAATAIAATVFPDVGLPTLVLPDHLGTTTGRPWLTDFAGLEPSTFLLCAVPAALGFVLLFLDQTITVRLVNSPDHNLRKAYGYNLDTLVVAFITAGLSLVGLPWCVAGTCPSMAHVRALATTAPDPAKGGAERVTAVLEQRVSNIGTHALILASVFAVGELKEIPVAALLGLFLHVGVQTAQGNEFLERLLLWVTDPARRPEGTRWERLDQRRVAAYTATQLFMLCLLWYLKGTRIGILFPLLILACVPARRAAEAVFTDEELALLDAE